MADGREVRSAQLVGAMLDIGDRSVRIERVTSETRGTRTVWLHHMQVVAADGSTSELCNADAQGARWALVVPDARGRRDVVCSSGAIGKCIRWGYAPRVGRDVHEACVRMVRADYGGDGETATRDGTTIAFCDRVGIHPCRGDERIEAGGQRPARPASPITVRRHRLARRACGALLRGSRGPACSIARARGAKLLTGCPNASSDRSAASAVENSSRSCCVALRWPRMRCA